MIGRLFFLLFLIQPVFAAVTTLEIETLTKAAIPQYLNYRVPVGRCFFKDINGEITTTNEIAHYQPDIVVVAYNQPGAIPWTELRLKNEMQLKRLVGGGGHLNTNAGRTQTYFKEAGVYGHPFNLSASQYICPRANAPGQAHFQSEEDARAWRGGSSQTSSGILPALGFIMESSAEKAAAVIAGRAAFLATGGRDNVINVSHQVSPASLNCPGPGCETFIATNDPKTTLWQPLLGPQNVKEDQVFVVWRCYRCCEPGPGIFIRKDSLYPGGCR